MLGASAHTVDVFAPTTADNPYFSNNVWWYNSGGLSFGFSDSHPSTNQISPDLNRNQLIWSLNHSIVQSKCRAFSVWKPDTVNGDFIYFMSSPLP